MFEAFLFRLRRKWRPYAILTYLNLSKIYECKLTRSVMWMFDGFIGCG